MSIKASHPDKEISGRMEIPLVKNQIFWDQFTISHTQTSRTGSYIVIQQTSNIDMLNDEVSMETNFVYSLCEQNDWQKRTCYMHANQDTNHKTRSDYSLSESFTTRTTEALLLNPTHQLPTRPYPTLDKCQARMIACFTVSANAVQLYKDLCWASNWAG